MDQLMSKLIILSELKVQAAPGHSYESDHLIMAQSMEAYENRFKKIAPEVEKVVFITEQFPSLQEAITRCVQDQDCSETIGVACAYQMPFGSPVEGFWVIVARQTASLPTVVLGLAKWIEPLPPEKTT